MDASTKTFELAWIHGAGIRSNESPAVFRQFMDDQGKA